jgi:hypothetical protein
MSNLQNMFARVRQNIEQQKFYIEIEYGNVYDVQYHVAKPINAEQQWPHMMSWVIQTFGPIIAKDGMWTPGQRWYANNARFWFQNEADLALFLLRWNS